MLRVDVGSILVSNLFRERVSLLTKVTLIDRERMFSCLPTVRDAQECSVVCLLCVMLVFRPSLL